MSSYLTCFDCGANHKIANIQGQKSGMISVNPNLHKKVRRPGKYLDTPKRICANKKMMYWANIDAY